MTRDCTPRSAGLSRGIALAAFAAVAFAPGLGHAASAPGSPHPQSPRLPDPPAAQATAAPDADPGSHSTVTRARMLECGHQWNNMKHAGTASGTWKDFSRGCLAQR